MPDVTLTRRGSANQLWLLLVPSLGARIHLLPTAVTSPEAQCCEGAHWNAEDGPMHPLWWGGESCLHPWLLCGGEVDAWLLPARSG